MGKIMLGGEMYLYGIVGRPDDEGGFSPRDVAEALAEHGPNELKVHINSPGGIAMDGMAIYSLLKSHPAKKSVAVDGVASSAASLLAMAGDEIHMRQGSMMMIHDPSGITIGPAKAHEETALTLHKLADNYAAVYAARSGNKVENVRAMMLATTWMGADDAISNGFATSKLDDKAIEAFAFDYRLFPNAPKELIARAPAVSWKASASRDLPVDDKSQWDGDAAAERMLAAAGNDPTKSRRGFLICASGNERGGYKLPFADIVGGELKAIAGGLRAAASRLPQIDAPQAVKDEARRVLDGYFARLRKQEESSANAARVRMSLRAEALTLA